jgi:hypothetical protein
MVVDRGAGKALQFQQRVHVRVVEIVAIPDFSIEALENKVGWLVGWLPNGRWCQAAPKLSTRLKPLEVRAARITLA